ncbi:hypothetical protein [Embleya sp. NPDC059237]|uniref:hypothetical protein n=1 Tax=Embleya sp. NPDC059237 TaxID=3346784 RepID=UPI00368060E4
MLRTALYPAIIATIAGTLAVLEATGTVAFNSGLGLVELCITTLSSGLTAFLARTPRNNDVVIVVNSGGPPGRSSSSGAFDDNPGPSSNGTPP